MAMGTCLKLVSMPSSLHSSDPSDSSDLMDQESRRNVSSDDCLRASFQPTQFNQPSTAFKVIIHPF